jgi:DNA-binding transcriptional LysR family regulator
MYWSHKRSGGILVELNQLEYFLAVSRLQHVTRAAEALSITQPALSHSIAKLEDELGVPLFERQGRNVQLNRYGQLFANRVEGVLQEIKRGKQEIEELTNPETGLVTLSFLNILGIQVIPQMVGLFRSKHPGIRFQLLQGTQSLIHQQLEAGLSDFCITSCHSKSEGTVEATLFSKNLYAVVPKNHPLSGAGDVNLRDLFMEPFIGLKSSCGLKAMTEDIFRKACFQPQYVYEAEDLPTVAGFVSVGLGISLLPKANGLMLDGMEWLNIKDVDCVCTVGMEWKENRYLSPAAKMFRDFMLAHYQVHTVSA